MSFLRSLMDDFKVDIEPACNSLGSMQDPRQVVKESNTHKLVIEASERSAL